MNIMKQLLFFIALIPFTGFAQFDFYGPESFGDILDHTFSKSWTPRALSSIENKKYVVIFPVGGKKHRCYKTLGL